jgi:hypothetical protein
MRRAITIMGMLLSIPVVGVVLGACAGDDSPTISSGQGRPAFSEYTEMVRRIAPPEYSTPQTAPGAIDPVWTHGEYSILGKVFTDEGDQTLYGALAHLDMYVENINSLMMVDDSTGEPFLKDSSWAQFHELTASTTIPSQCQAGLGMTSVSLSNLVKMQPPTDPAGSVWEIAFDVSNNEQTMLLFRRSQYESNWDVDVYYAWADLADSAFDIRQVRFSDNANGTVDKTILRISGDVHESFAYRMSWYSEDLGDGLLGAIIGGGDKDVEFALRYHEYFPADSADCTTCLEQVFGPNYTEGTGLLSSYSQYLDESLLFLNDDMPVSEPTSPWGAIQ